MITAFGSTAAILAGMFRQHDAHVTAFQLWRGLHRRGLCDEAGIITIGRYAGRRAAALDVQVFLAQAATIRLPQKEHTS